jgi:hypothetical protein
MTFGEMYDLMTRPKDGADNLRVSIEDGMKFLLLIQEENAIRKFNIEILGKEGKMIFKRAK